MEIKVQRKVKGKRRENEREKGKDGDLKAKGAGEEFVW